MAEESCDSEKCICAQVERERILAEIDKLKPFLDENGVANWFKHIAYVRAVKGEE